MYFLLNQIIVMKRNEANKIINELRKTPAKIGHFWIQNVVKVSVVIIKMIFLKLTT